MTERAIEDLFRTAQFVSPDKLNWRPMGTGRSVLEQIDEVALLPAWYGAILTVRGDPVSTEAERRIMEEQRAGCQSLDDWHDICRKNSQDLYAIIADFPDADLDTTIVLPYHVIFTRESTCTVAEIMMLHYTNAVYHTGQINYIQRLYGDMQEHLRMTS